MRYDDHATVTDLGTAAPAFVEMANRIVYASVATADRRGRIRSRMVHTLWEWDGAKLTGWAGTVLTPIKKAQLAEGSYASCSYWGGVEAYDTCTAECRATLLLDEAGKREGWEKFASTPPPVGYNPAEIMPGWSDGPTSPGWAVIRFDPWHLRVFPGTFARSGGTEGAIYTWQEGELPG